MCRIETERQKKRESERENRHQHLLIETERSPRESIKQGSLEKLFFSFSQTSFFKVLQERIHDLTRDIFKKKLVKQKLREIGTGHADQCFVSEAVGVRKC